MCLLGLKIKENEQHMRVAVVGNCIFVHPKKISSGVKLVA